MASPCPYLENDFEIEFPLGRNVEVGAGGFRGLVDPVHDFTVTVRADVAASSPPCIVLDELLDEVTQLTVN